MEDFPNKSKYNELRVEIKYPISEFEVELKGIRSMVGFFQKELEFWESSRATGSEPIVHFIRHFQLCRDELNAFERNHRETDENTFKTGWESVYGRLRLSKVDGFHLLQSRTPVGQFIFSVTDENPTQGLSAYYFLTRRTSNFSDVDLAIGNLKAYEFLMQDESQIVKRRNSEKKAIGQIRNHIEQLGVDLQAEFDDNVLKYNEWRGGVEKDLDEWKTPFVEKVEGWYQERDEQVETFIDASNKKVVELEKLYTELLRLEGPVKHWRLRAVALGKTGRRWAWGLVGSTVVTAVVVLGVLFSPPDSFSASIVNGDPLAIKGVILYGTVISFMAYLIKTFSKMTFSSFHLMRDAEEREQLTLGYLALLEKGDGAVTEKERELILEALFSRSETGLIKHESGPTMPGLTGLVERAQGRK